MSFIALEEMDRMAAEIEEEIGVGKVRESKAYKEWRAAIEKAQQVNEERKAREKPRQMMDTRGRRKSFSPAMPGMRYTKYPQASPG